MSQVYAQDRNCEACILMIGFCRLPGVLMSIQNPTFPEGIVHLHRVGNNRGPLPASLRKKVGIPPLYVAILSSFLHDVTAPAEFRGASEDGNERVRFIGGSVQLLRTGRAIPVVSHRESVVELLITALLHDQRLSVVFNKDDVRMILAERQLSALGEVTMRLYFPPWLCQKGKTMCDVFREAGSEFHAIGKNVDLCPDEVFSAQLEVLERLFAVYEPPE